MTRLEMYWQLLQEGDGRKHLYLAWEYMAWEAARARIVL